MRAVLSSSLVSTALLTLTSSASAQVTQAPLPQAFPSAVSASTALASFDAGELARLAQRNGTSVAELREILSTHQTAWVSGAGDVFFVDTAVPSQRGAFEDIEPVRPRQAITQTEAFTLNSMPGADITIYLDFDGHHSVNNSWGHNIMFTAFDTNGDPSTFSQAELDTIFEQWRRVVEDFAPFVVNVTTEEPPVGDLRKQGGGDTRWGVRCLMTQPTSGFGNGIGGVAFLNSFDDSIDNPVFTFNKGNNNGSMTASHEVGHALGLSHDGLNGSEYHPGAGGNGATGWGPIMGAPFGKNLVQWSNGSYAGSTTTQNDLNIITRTSNGLVYKADDQGDAVPSADPALALSCPTLGRATVNGLIEDRNDVDTYRFRASGGDVSIAVDTVPGPNVDALLELYDDSGMLVASNNFIGQVNASLDVTLDAGEYTVLVDGTERLPRYDDYGSIGQYTLTITEPIWTSVPAGTGSGPQLTGFGQACELEPIEMLVQGAPANGVVYVLFGHERLTDASVDGLRLVPDLRAQGGVHVVQADAEGTARLTRLWPAGMPAGTRVSFQAWMADTSTAVGLTATNAVEISVR